MFVDSLICGFQCLWVSEFTVSVYELPGVLMDFVSMCSWDSVLLISVFMDFCVYGSLCV